MATDVDALRDEVRKSTLRTYHAAVAAALRYKFPQLRARSLKAEWFFCPNKKGLTDVLELWREVGGPADGLVEFLKKFGFTAIVSLDHHPFLLVVVLDPKFKEDGSRLTTCVFRNLSVMIVNAQGFVDDDADLDKKAVIKASWGEREEIVQKKQRPGRKQRQNKKKALLNWIAMNGEEVSLADYLVEVRKVGFQSIQPITLDNTFVSVPVKQMDEFIEIDRTDKRQYVSEVYDCDDFARDFSRNATRMGITSVGVVLDRASAHAYNVVLTSDKGILKCRAYEPQESDEKKCWVKLGEGSYKAKGGYIIL